MIIASSPPLTGQAILYTISVQVSIVFIDSEYRSNCVRNKQFHFCRNMTQGHFLSEYKRLAAPFLRIRPTIRITLSSSPPFVLPAADHSLQSHVSFVCPEASSSVQHPTSRPRGFPLQYPSLSIVACAHFPPVPMRFKLIQSKRTQVVPLTPHA